jgi:hypothetical protein
MRLDFSNPEFMDYAEEAPDIVAAIDLGREQGGSDRVICFDGSYGAINCSPAMAEHLYELAPGCNEIVDDVLLPRWLKQRGLWREPVNA